MSVRVTLESVSDMSLSPQRSEPAGEDEFIEFFATETTEGHVTDMASDVLQVSVSRAAELLGITERSVWRRIQKKQLESRLDHGKTVISLRQSDVRQTPTDSDTVISARVIGDGPNLQEPSETPHALGTVPVDLAQELMRKLEVLTYRNGYLEAQLAEKEVQIKLLTDSQHSGRGWWQRFSWLFKTRQPDL